MTSQLKLIVVSGEDKAYSNLWERVEVGCQQSNLLPSYERVLKKIYSSTLGKNRLVLGIHFKYRLNLSVANHCIMMKLLLEKH